MSIRRNAGISMIVLAITATEVMALSQRTFVSTTGNDANPCTRQQPCRNFTAAAAQTASSGEIYVLDSGGYGRFSTLSALTIKAEGVSAGITAFAGEIAIQIGTVAIESVILRGLSIQGLGGDTGIRFTGAGAVHIENCTIDGFENAGIESLGIGELYVKDSVIRDNPGAPGLAVHTSSGLSRASVDGSRLENNETGVLAGENSRVVVRNSVAAGNSGTGFFASANSMGQAELTLESCVSAHNNLGVGAEGLEGQGISTVRLSNVTVVNNVTGLATFGSGGTSNPMILSFGNNRIHGNGTNGSPSSTLSQN